MNSIEALLGLFFLVGSNSPLPLPGVGNPNVIPEVINTPDAVIIKATSRGCTKKRHFRVHQGEKDNLQAVRLKKDRCQQDPRIVEFRYTHKQMGLERPASIQGTRIASN